MRGFLVALGLLTAVAGPVLAEEPSPLRAMITANDSRGWEGVGRIDIAGRSFCTGALIEPDLVLTAAHCLYDKYTHKQVDVGEVQFLAGFRNGHASAYRDVRRVSIHPEYEYKGPEDATSVASDLALLELSQPIRNFSVEPFETADRPRKGAEVGVVSYARDRAMRPSIQESCHVLGRPAGALVLSCEVDFGSSGAPVFEVTENGARIVSVVSAKAEIFGREVSLSTPVEGSLTILRAQLMQRLTSTEGAGSVPRVTRLTTPGSGGDGGAKFLRP
jgi:V8-like Glu-specific endopeptidase